MKDYEMAQIIAEQAPRMARDRIREFKKTLRNFIENNRQMQYPILLGMPSRDGNSTRYVTLFNIKPDTDITNKTNAIFEFLLENEESLGELKGFLYNDTENYIEVWYNNECYLLFNYDKGVVEIGY